MDSQADMACLKVFKHYHESLILHYFVKILTIMFEDLYSHKTLIDFVLWFGCDMVLVVNCMLAPVVA